MNISELQPFVVSNNDRLILDREFKRLLDGCDLGGLRATTWQTSVTADTGCYAWLMRVDSMSYKVYVGRANSMLRRVSDYSGGFQIHSPNDFKMRFFEDAVKEFYPSAVFDLYFCATAKDLCNAREGRVRNFVCDA